MLYWIRDTPLSQIRYLGLYLSRLSSSISSRCSLLSYCHSSSLHRVPSIAAMGPHRLAFFPALFLIPLTRTRWRACCPFRPASGCCRFFPGSTPPFQDLLAVAHCPVHPRFTTIEQVILAKRAYPFVSGIRQLRRCVCECILGSGYRASRSSGRQLSRQKSKSQGTNQILVICCRRARRGRGTRIG
jgi:hypothetical protein